MEKVKNKDKEKSLIAKQLKKLKEEKEGAITALEKYLNQFRGGLQRVGDGKGRHRSFGLHGEEG